MLTAIAINVGVSLISTGIGALAHWFAGKHTRKSAIASNVASAVGTAAGTVKVTIPAPAKTTK